MRYFPAQFLTEPCDPHAGPNPDAGVGAADTGCMADEVCLDEGLCARQSTELRYCVKTCSSGDDCRAGYECRLAGTRGSMALTSNPNAIVHFCAPRT